jgi:hypothetical protein
MERDISRETAERLLGGALTPPPEGAEQLAALLAAASAPARPHELAGEAAAMAAFRAHPPTVRRWSLRRAVTIKVAAVVAAAVAAGGVALASSAGLLPNPFQAPGVQGSPSSPASPGDGSHPPMTTPGTGAHTPPPEALPGLCHSYQAKPPAERGKALEAQPFDALVRAAGGPEHVDGFCERVLASPEPDKSKDNGPNKTQTTPTPPVNPPVTPKTMPSRANLR